MNLQTFGLTVTVLGMLAASPAAADPAYWIDNRGVYHFPFTPRKMRPTARVQQSHARADGSTEARIRRYDQHIRDAAARYALPPALLYAIIHEESGGYPCIVSSAGAVGLMQLMPATARHNGVRNRCNPRENVMGGSRYLRWCLNRYHGNLRLALAAYSAGSGAVDQYGGVPPYRETVRYIPIVLAHYRRYHERL